VTPVSQLAGMSLVALNLKMAETERRYDEVEIIDFDEAEIAEHFAETADVDDPTQDVEIPLARGPSPPGEAANTMTE